jgi:hypothetical protein
MLLLLLLLQQQQQHEWLYRLCGQQDIAFTLESPARRSTSDTNQVNPHPLIALCSFFG